MSRSQEILKQSNFLFFKFIVPWRVALVDCRNHMSVRFLLLYCQNIIFSLCVFFLIYKKKSVWNVGNTIFTKMYNCANLWYIINMSDQTNVSNFCLWKWWDWLLYIRYIYLVISLSSFADEACIHKEKPFQNAWIGITITLRTLLYFEDLWFIFEHDMDIYLEYCL